MAEASLFSQMAAVQEQDNFKAVLELQCEENELRKGEAKLARKEYIQVMQIIMRDIVLPPSYCKKYSRGFIVRKILQIILWQGYVYWMTLKQHFVCFKIWNSSKTSLKRLEQFYCFLSM
jgi:hypothetical protein